jgi:hypothetical protein
MDQLRPSAAPAVKALADMNIKVVLLTGDTKSAAEAVRDVFERQERRRIHQELAEEQWRRSGLAQDMDRLLGSPRAGVVGLFDLLDGFEDPILLLEITPPLAAIRKAFGDHRAGFHAKEDVEQVVGIAAHQRAGEGDQPLRGASQDAKAVALSGVARKLVKFIRNREVEPSPHVAADEFDLMLSST